MKSIFFVHKKSLEWFIYTGTGDGWASVFAHFRESHPEWSGMHQSDFTVTELKTTQVADKHLTTDELLPNPTGAELLAQGWQHVAYYEEGQFHWVSGIAPRDCELYQLKGR